MGEDDIRRIIPVILLGGVGALWVLANDQFETIGAIIYLAFFVLVLVGYTPPVRRLLLRR